ncbi:MAG TPA: 3-hydroxyacyl-ACP dehydratase FabZ [Limnochordales bacterium]
MSGSSALEIDAILERIPHRYPFLLVDRVLELESGRRAVAIKNVTINEPFFQGHYPDFPIMPGVLILEALAQAAAIMMYPHVNRTERLPVLAGIDGARFRRMVRPGDCLRLEVEMVRARSGLGVVAGRAWVDGQLACEAEFLFGSRSMEGQGKGADQGGRESS